MEIRDNMTIEELRAEMIKGQEEISTLTKDKENLTTEVQKRDTRITELQETNQKFFLRITQPEGKGTKEETVKSVEEIASELAKII